MKFQFQNVSHKFFLGIAFLLTVNAQAAVLPASIMGKDDWSNQGFVLKTWMNYSGPQVVAPSKFTTAKNGKTDKALQHLDTLLTIGYHVADGIVPGVGTPLDVILGEPKAQLKAPYFGIIEARLFQSNRIHIVADLRFYLPVGSVAQSEDFQTAVRTSQTIFYEVPGTALTLGATSFFRRSLYGKNGSGPRKEIELFFSPFAKFPLSSTVAATLWTDWVQLVHEYGKPSGLVNFPVNIQPGIKWDFSRGASINPYISILPSNLNATSVGMIINTRLL